MQTPQLERVIIISMTGAVVKNEQQIGLKRYDGLQRGVYVMKVGKQVFKIRNYSVDKERKVRRLYVFGIFLLLIERQKTIGINRITLSSPSMILLKYKCNYEQNHQRICIFAKRTYETDK